MNTVRCAIYTRKSTEEGLDKEFNTLEAQRESGENYVKSQSYQGWEIIPTRYDDGVVYTLKPRRLCKVLNIRRLSVVETAYGWPPTPAIGKKARGKRVTPALYEKMKGVRLRFVYRANGVSLLVHEQKRKTIIALILVPQVKMPKLINFAGESEKWKARVPTLILENWK